MRCKLTLTSVVVEVIDFDSLAAAEEYAVTLQTEVAKGRPAREKTTVSVEPLPEPAEVTS